MDIEIYGLLLIIIYGKYFIKNLETHLLAWLLFKKEQRIINVCKNVEKLEPLSTEVGNIKWCGNYKKQFGGGSSKS